jgi:hypothetical protein
VEILSKAEVSPNPINEHPFGCPVYILAHKVQGGIKGEKWGDRSRPAIYLGNSTQYSRSVGLALSLTTGLVSPHFHAKYDDEFETVSINNKYALPDSKWQTKCHFITSKEVNAKDYHIPTVPITQATPADLMREHQSTDNPTPDDFIPREEPTVPTETPAIPEPAPITEPTPPNVVIMRSGRISRPPRALTQDMVVYESIEDISQVDPEIDWMSPLAFAASSDQTSCTFMKPSCNQTKLSSSRL